MAERKVYELTYTEGRYNVNYLLAPYELLARAFSGDGTEAPRDTDKSLAQWNVKTPYGMVEVYDYRDEHDRREDVTDWHVQAVDDRAIDCMLDKVREANR